MSRVSLLLAALLLTASSAYLSDSWMLSSERPTGPRCVPIPHNLTICYGMQYSQMRLPNLLEHETINEAIHQSSDWKSLLQLNCHPDTQLFLCSLFAPICLPTMDKEIFPCRSLCQAVKQGCEGRMSVYGFPWPEMLSCDKYPEDNDMCIKAMNNEKQGKLARPMHARDISCPACSQVGTYENLVDHFCRSQLVVKARVNAVTPTHISLRNARSLKKGDRRRSVDDTDVRLSSDSSECPCNITDGPERRFLVMASKSNDGQLVANLILPWKKEKVGGLAFFARVGYDQNSLAEEKEKESEAKEQENR
ncbi:hypothetical protein Y032_0009g505 [Ancylostoma ceylanicum]|uniref:FZ domain-containing protein n=2 Tax=Ancylostoma ceylanicum TaxID=53326 RepID=A0A016VJ94_9BILA|nr:hypothetical protein Y032_0009g505 [Ancylostoma ceylanicum]